MQTNRR